MASVSFRGSEWHKSLFSALLAYEVGAAEGSQQDDAGANGRGGTLVAIQVVVRQYRSVGHVTIHSGVAEIGIARNAVVGIVGTVEEAVATSEGGHAQSEDNRDCQC